jgi:RNA polymerase sigma-70 factor (ECF subfamily)
MSSRQDEALTNLFREYASSVRRYLRRIVAAPEVAEELAQEAFARIHSSARSTGIDSPRYFLFRTARNLALNHLLRQRAVTFEHLEDRPGFEIGDEAPSVERWLSAREELELVRTVIAELPPKCRQVFLLLRIQGLSVQEVMREMGLSETMVRKYAARALDHCQNRLAHLRSE